ncbi:MAG TPA: rod shape-determining protein MreC [Bacteroidales bacterium]|nr:rod shape-determining protein MreC [Bacteroidales bacterium]
MNNLYEILKRLYIHLVFLILLGVSLSLYFNTTYYQKSQVSAVTKSITGFWHKQASKVSNLFQLQRSNVLLLLENVKLRNEIEGYRLKLQMLQDSLMRIDDTSGVFRYIPARVIDNSINSRHNYITLDVGSNDGAYKGMGVICKNNVVGIVSATTKHFASVISLLNTDVRVSAMHKKSGSFGALSWDGMNYRRVVLDEIPLHVNVAVGDSIVTSGFSTIFPKDIPVGRVVDFYIKDGSFLQITVELFADFKTLTYVYLVDSKAKNEIDSLQTMK